MNKFRKERYIEQSLSSRTNKWSFRVRYGSIRKTFNEDDYLSSSQAFKKAVEFRNRLLLNMPDEVTPSNTSVIDCYNMIPQVYVLRSETKRKLDCYFQKYISKKDIRIIDITRADIISDLNAMVEDVSTDTIQRVFSIWRKIFGVALAHNFINKDITINIKPPLSHKIKQNKRLELTNEELLIKLKNYLKKHVKSHLEGIQFGLIPLALLYSGMRPAELLALNKNDIDLKKKLIHINKECGSNRDEINVIRQCKTEMSVRDIPISKKLLPILKEAIELSPNDLLLPDRFGNHYDSTDLGNRIHNHAKNIGIDFHLYQCRHTFITILYMNGIDLKTIQELCGQVVDSTTIGYVVTDEKRKINAMNLI